MNEQNFTDLAVISIYNYCDVLYEARAKAAFKRLYAAKVLGGDFDEAGNDAYELYEAMVVEYAKERLPDNYTLQHDKWGAKCMSDHKGWNAPQFGLYCGSEMGRIMWFDSIAAMKEYTDDQFRILPALSDTH